MCQLIFEILELCIQLAVLSEKTRVLHDRVVGVSTENLTLTYPSDIGNLKEQLIPMREHVWISNLPRI